MHYLIKKYTSFERIPYLPKIALRWPSRVCKMTDLIWSTSFPRNCSAAVARNSFSVITLHCATPVTVKGTPWAVSTCSQRGERVITSNESLKHSLYQSLSLKTASTLAHIFDKNYHKQIAITNNSN